MGPLLPPCVHRLLSQEPQPLPSSREARLSSGPLCQHQTLKMQRLKELSTPVVLTGEAVRQRKEWRQGTDQDNSMLNSFNSNTCLLALAQTPLSMGKPVPYFIWF